MKVRNLSFVIAIASISINLIAQNPDDALRYSQLFYTGTARFSSMGGAFTALGGDMSAMVLNPAGTGLFRKSEFSISPHFGYTNTSTYYTSNNEDMLYNYRIGQAGVVIPMILNSSSAGLTSLVMGYSYNMTANYSNSAVIKGISSTSSMADYWAEISNGFYCDELTGIRGYAFDTWLIDTITGSGEKYYGTVFSRYGDEPVSVYGQNLKRVITNQGFGGEHSLSIGLGYNNNLFLGATLGFARINYTGHYEHLESDPNNVIYDFNSFSYVDHFEADGRGFSVKAGLIYVPVDFLRIGMAVHSPVIYKIKENYYENLTSSFDDGDRHEVRGDAFRYNYRLTTPFRLLGGVAVMIQKSALVSIDYELVDYSIARFSMASDNYDYHEENQAIREIFTAAQNIRAGAEYRFGSLYLRGGYGYYGRAFSKDEVNRDSYHTSWSAGIGFRQSDFFLDFGFSRLSDSMQYFMYNIAHVDPVTIETTRNTFSATLGLKF